LRARSALSAPWHRLQPVWDGIDPSLRFLLHRRNPSGTGVRVPRRHEREVERATIVAELHER